MNATRTLVRGLEVIETLARSNEPLGPTAVAERVGIDKATAGRLLFTLCQTGYAHADAAGRYQLSHRLLMLSHDASRDLLAHSRAHLAALRDRTGETVQLGVYHGGRVTCVEEWEGTYPVRVPASTEMPRSLHRTALGTVALVWIEAAPRSAEANGQEETDAAARVPLPAAEIQATRARGFAVTDEQERDGVVSIAAPLLRDGRVEAIIGLVGPSFRLGNRVDELGGMCRRTAIDIVRDQLWARARVPA